MPAIEVFAGEGQTVKEGQEVEYTASFLRPSELWDYTYKWDFGDGSTTVTGMPEEGSTRLQVATCLPTTAPQGYGGGGYGNRNERRRGGDGLRFFLGRGYGIQGLDRWGLAVGETTKSAVRASQPWPEGL